MMVCPGLMLTEGKGGGIEKVSATVVSGKFNRVSKFSLKTDWLKIKEISPLPLTERRESGIRFSNPISDWITGTLISTSQEGLVSSFLQEKSNKNPARADKTYFICICRN